MQSKSGDEVRLPHQERDQAEELGGDAEASPPVTSIAFAARQPLLATTAYDGTAHLWDTETGQEKAHWQADSESNGHVVAFSPDGETIVTGLVRRQAGGGVVLAGPLGHAAIRRIAARCFRLHPRQRNHFGHLR